MRQRILNITPITFLLLLLLPTQMAVAAAPLRGSASYSESNGHVDVLPLQGKIYQAATPLVLQGDEAARAYKLGLAERKYRNALLLDKDKAGAYNGLGKILYYRTASSSQSVRDQRDELLQQAERDFLAAIRLHQTYAEARLNLGMIYQQQGRLDEAHEEFARVLTLTDLPNELAAEALTRVGSVLVSKSKFNEAQPYLENALLRNPNNVSTRYFLARVYTEQGLYDQAHEQLIQALSRQPDNASIHHQLGVVYENQGNGAAAVAEYKKTLTLKPELRKPSEDLAAHYLARGDRSFALEQLKNTQEAYPKDLQLLLKVGSLSLAENQPDIARRYYAQAAQRTMDNSPEHQQAIQGIARAERQLAENRLSAQNEYKRRLGAEWEAHDNLQAAVNHNPADLDTQLLRLRLNQKMPPNHVETVAYSPATYSLSDYNATVRQVATAVHEDFARGEVLLDRYQFSQAEKAFEQAILSITNDKDATTMGEMLMTLGMPEEAHRAFDRASQLGAAGDFSRFCQQRARQAHEDSRHEMDIGLQQLKKGPEHAKSALAEEYLMKALRHDQKNADAHYYLARHYEAKKLVAKAVDQYYAYLALDPMGKNAEEARHKLRYYEKKGTL